MTGSCLGLLQRFLEAARQRVVARLLRFHRLFEERLASRRFGGEDARARRSVPACRRARGSSCERCGRDSRRRPASTGSRGSRARVRSSISPCRYSSGVAGRQSAVGDRSWPAATTNRHDLHDPRLMTDATGDPARRNLQHPSLPRPRRPHNPTRIAEVIRAIDADIIALQEVIGAGPSVTGQAEELGALLGMGWVMAPTRHLRGSLFGNVVLSRLPIRAPRALRPVVEDVRAALLPACRHRARRRHAAPLQRAPRDRVSRTPVPGRTARQPSCTIVASACRRSCSAISTNGCAGWRRDAQRAPAEHRPARTPATAPHLSRRVSGPASRSHLLRGQGGGGEGWNCRGRGCR